MRKTREIQFDAGLARQRISDEIDVLLGPENTANTDGLFEQHKSIRFRTNFGTVQLIGAGAGAVGISRVGIFPERLGGKTQIAILTELAIEAVTDLSENRQARLAVTTWKDRGRLCVPIARDIPGTITDAREFKTLLTDSPVECIPVADQQRIATEGGL